MFFITIFLLIWQNLVSWEKLGRLGIEDQLKDPQDISEIGNHSILSTGSEGYSSVNSQSQFNIYSQGGRELNQSFSYFFNASTLEYCCSTCTYKSKYKSSTVRHLRTHSGDKPYHCELCQQLFAHSSGLKRHLSVHSGTRPHLCEICNKTFCTASLLKEHMPIHFPL